MHRSARGLGLWSRLISFYLLGLGGLGHPSFAAPPILESLLPAGGQIGTTVEVKASGKLGSGPLEYWVDRPGLTIRAGSSNNQFSVLIDSNVVAGPCLIRAWNNEGASKPRIFSIGFLPEYLEEEPNNARAQAVKVQTCPVIYNGRLEKSGDIDSFALELTAGSTLVAVLDAYTLGSPLDAHLHLFDPTGNRVAFNHDDRTLDPLLVYSAARSGVHTLQVAGFAHPPQADVRFAGSSATVYRLTLTTGPFADYTFPSGIKRGALARVEVHGFNLDSTSGNSMTEVEARGPKAVSDFLLLRGPGWANQLRLAVSEDEPERENEPDDSSPQRVTPPLIIHGRIDSPGDVDRFAFSARKGDRLEFVLDSNRLGLPLDGVLQLEDLAGAELGRDDDGGGERDPRITWTAKNDSTNVVQVGDLFGRGGPRFIYQLRIGPPLPTFAASLGQDSFRLEPGKSTEIKLTIKRSNDHTNGLAVHALGLPLGVSLGTNEVPSKSGEVKLSLAAETNAIPTNISFALFVSETTGSGHASRFALVSLQAEEPRGDYLINSTSNLWLTIPRLGP